MSYRLASCVLLLMIVGHGCEPSKPSSTPAPIAPPASSTNMPATAPARATPAPAADPGVQQPKAETVKSETTKIVVAAASDLRFVMPELVKEFNQQHPKVVVESTFGSSGTLFAQIANEAPFDVFLSADIQYPQKLAEQGLTKPDSLFHYAVGHIVLWVRKDSPLQVEEMGIKVLTDERMQKIAIANPKLAPYGRAAEAALKKLEVYETIKDKLVLGENIAQTAQFAETGAADVAIIGLSFAMAPAFAGKGKYWEFPQDTYPLLDQGGVIMKNTRQPEAAQAFCDFLKSPAAGAILKKYGFVLPETK